MDIGYSNAQLLSLGSIEINGDRVTFSPEGGKVRVVLIHCGDEHVGIADGGALAMEGNQSAGILVGVMLMRFGLEAGRDAERGLVSVMAPHLPGAVQAQLDAVAELLRGIAERHPGIRGFEVQGDPASGFRVTAVGGGS